MEHTRYRYLDFLRGFSIFLMVFYHFGFNLVTWNIIPEWILFNPVLDNLQLLFSSVFVFISGISSAFSKSNYKRGAKLLMLSLVITLVTYLFDPQLVVRFGILHFLGFASIIYQLLRPVITRLNIHGGIWLALFLVFNIALNRTFSVPHLWALGITVPGFSSSDYFPIFPWIFMYFFGVWLSQFVISGSLPSFIQKLHNSFFEKLGRLSLWIYIGHQPILVGITLVLTHIIGLQ